MALRWKGRDLLFANPDLAGRVINVAAVKDVRLKKQELGFLLWGGSKTWLSPQPRWTDGVPFLDLDSGPYELIVENKSPEYLAVSMVSAVCRETGVRITRSLTVRVQEPGWTITHKIVNESGRPVEWGIWDVTMILKPGCVYIPRGPSPYRDWIKTFEEEGQSILARETAVSEMGSLAVIRSDSSRSFKFGVNAQGGWMLGILDVGELGLVGYRKSVPASCAKSLGYGCTAEVYNSERHPYFEMEVHGPVMPIPPGGGIELEEREVLFDIPQWPANEARVRAYAE